MINPMLEAEVLAHLDNQLRSGQRLLRLVLDQGEAIRSRDSERVLAKLAEIQTEMGRRGRLEQERTQLLQSAGAQLGMSPQQVTLEHLCVLITRPGAAAVNERSSELRGLLGEIAREHGINRALMRQELAFLSHLVRLVGDEHDAGYQASGAPPDAAPAPYSLHRTLDLKA